MNGEYDPSTAFYCNIKTESFKTEKNCSGAVPSYHKLLISASPPLPCLTVWSSPTHPSLSLGLDRAFIFFIFGTGNTFYKTFSLS